MSEWISVKDRMPDVGEWVLTFSEKALVDIEDFPFDIGYLRPDGEWRHIGWEYEVTHWMPLPEPPNP